MTEHVVHPFPPLYDSSSEILLLGSFPSVKSREGQFFYNHPQNRFWKVLAALENTPVPVTIPEKKQWILSHQFALWDVIQECDIEGSSDASVRNAVPTDLSVILRNAPIRRILVNGKTADRLFQHYQRQKTSLPEFCCPSTSPANAAWHLPDLIRAWGEAMRRPLPAEAGGEKR